MEKNRLWEIGGLIAVGIILGIVVWNLFFQRRNQYENFSYIIGRVVRGTADCEEEEEVMNELERTALNEILRTVTYIAEKVDEQHAKIAFLQGCIDGLKLRFEQVESEKDSQEQ